MSEPLRASIAIGLDLMGGDEAPESNIQGCLAALEEGYRITAFGDEDAVGTLRSRISSPQLETVLCTEAVLSHESPLQAIRKKPDSSIRRGIEAVKSGMISAFVSAGSTGALVAAGALILGRANGVDKPCLATVIPSKNSRGVLFLDLGASADVRPQTLVQFAVMGSAYAERVLGWESPKVFLLNNGIEPEKGNALTKKAFDLLQGRPVRFSGNIEARDVFSGAADIVVADGFSGNIFLKACEGTAAFLLDGLRREISSGFVKKMAALVLRPALRKVRDALDYSRYGGAPLLGLEGCVVKCHGSSGPEAIANGIVQAHRFVARNVSEVISNTLAQMSLEGE